MTGAQPADAAKLAAARAAAGGVLAGMRVGLGTGSTAALFITALGGRVAAGLDIVAFASSRVSAEQALALGIKVAELDGQPLDICIDGADIVDPDLRLIKGGGGAHVRERIVAQAADRFVVIVDDAKLSDTLRGPLPLEVLEFGMAGTLTTIAKLCGAPASLRLDAAGAPRRSDNGNLLADVAMDQIADPEGLAADLDAVAGLVDHGMFLGMTDLVIAGSADGTVRQLAPAR